MDESSAPEQERATAPIFGAYRRGYDPEQVDRYVGDQQRRLDDALHRASEAERKLGAAIGQLRELHRRVAVLESEERSPQPPALDTLGERVQRILNEAWEGAYALRQQVEQEASEQRERAELEAAEIIATAEERAARIDEEAARRSEQQHERIEQARSRAVSQISYLHNQRKMAVGELVRLKGIIETTVAELEPPVPHTDRRTLVDADEESVLEPSSASHEDPVNPSTPRPRPADDTVAPVDLSDEERARRESPVRFQRPKLAGSEPPRTMPVHHLRVDEGDPRGADPSLLVRDHRAAEAALHLPRSFEEILEAPGTDAGSDEVPRAGLLYDFESD